MVEDDGVSTASSDREKTMFELRAFEVEVVGIERVGFDAFLVGIAEWMGVADGVGGRRVEWLGRKCGGRGGGPESGAIVGALSCRGLMPRGKIFSGCAPASSKAGSAPGELLATEGTKFVGGGLAPSDFNDSKLGR